MLSILDLILLLMLTLSFIIVSSRVYFTKMGGQEYALTFIFSLVYLISYKILLIIFGVLSLVIAPSSLVAVEVSVLGALYTTIWVMGFFKGSERYASRVKTAFGSLILGLLLYSIVVFILTVMHLL